MRNTFEKQPVQYGHNQAETRNKNASSEGSSKSRLEAGALHQSPVFFWGGPHFLYTADYRRK